MNILFVCSRNQWRSPTAEAIYKNHPEHVARSAGTVPSARVRVTEKLIIWADIIFVMEKKHRQRLTETFPAATACKQVVILAIPDEYGYMDNELIDIIQVAASPYL